MKKKELEKAGPQTTIEEAKGREKHAPQPQQQKEKKFDDMQQIQKKKNMKTKMRTL
jgi:hypothetical protein